MLINDFTVKCEQGQMSAELMVMGHTPVCIHVELETMNTQKTLHQSAWDLNLQNAVVTPTVPSFMSDQSLQVSFLI